MNILIVSAEFAPLAKTGGLADATAGLSLALEARGHDVRILLPAYRDVPDADTLDIAHAGTTFRYRHIEHAGLRSVYLLEHPSLPANGQIYYGDERDAARFIHLSEGALALCAALDWEPQIVHCHDWHAALIPVLMAAKRSERRAARLGRSILTLHNIGYQGIFDARVLEASGCADLRAWFDPDDLAASSINLLKAGIMHADALTTVSPTYATEIQTAAFGMGLETALAERRDDLAGILNGVDYRTWSPDADPYIARRYDADSPALKVDVKADVLARLGLPTDTGVPLIGLVSRLVAQKGIDLLIDAAPALLARRACVFAALGAGDPALTADLSALAERAPDRFAFAAGYDEALAHRIVAGSDLLMIPSRYEPCGLTQLYALRYGTIPVVRATGGLADTVRHFDPATGVGNGCVFEHADAQGLTWGVEQALDWLADDGLRSRLMRNAVAADYSWRRQVSHYEAVYRRLIEA